ncbi:RNA polymerase II elongation factor [Perilla frutescens var. hirtella]|uniref:RNA polymerase II elongation factor n=1 Tax=Perilla frutescens var. hirtella TaxID=608512 RepID=A0AAD4IWH1_PERFH|nr:RNA polymerase II elongation factor [Perilla frutescens var. hirtella]
MAESKETHVVEIPVDEEHRHKEAMQSHPLAEISRSPGHFLLLKLWQREEELFGRRMSRKESRMDTTKGEIFQLCSQFFLFHGLFFTILFTSSPPPPNRCAEWWLPALLSGGASLAVVLLVQAKLWRYWKVEGQLQRERAAARGLTRCVQELRMKGASFDLSKEPNKGKRLKSSSVEIKWGPLTWCSHYRLSLFLASFAGLALLSCRLLLCS